MPNQTMGDPCSASVISCGVTGTQWRISRAGACVKMLTLQICRISFNVFLTPSPLEGTSIPVLVGGSQVGPGDAAAKCPMVEQFRVRLQTANDVAAQIRDKGDSLSPEDGAAA